MKIAVLGGRFDPPHLGHLSLAKEVLKLRPDIEKILFIPVFDHNWSPSIASASHRLSMLKSFLPSKMEASDIEIKRGGKSYTIDTIEELKKQTDAEIYWVVGSDVLPRFSEWKDANKLPKLVTFFVYPRPGFEAPDNLPAGFEKLNTDSTFAISSTEIRNRIKDGKSIRELVPAEVEKYIIKHKLYG